MTTKLTVAITGASGFVGGHLCNYFLSQGYFVVGIYNKRAIHFDSELFEGVQLDLRDQEETIRFFSDKSFDLVIHAAALADARLCEEDPKLAYQVNRDATGNVIQGIQSASCNCISRLIYISTDLVFDGYSASDVPKDGLTENFPAKVLSVYAKSKLAAEKLVLGSELESIVTRISIVYGEAINGKGCFIEWMKEALSTGKKLTLFDDEFRRPLLINDLGRALKVIAENFPKDRRLFHISGPQRISRYEFGLLFAKAYSLDSSSIVARKRSEVMSTPPRPEDVSLDNSLVKITFDLDFTRIENSLNEYSLV